MSNYQEAVRGQATVIIPVYNDVENLKVLLDDMAPRAQRLDWQVIVVDDQSPDQAGEVARTYGVDVIRLEQNSGVAIARNTGAAAAKNPVLVFVDSDTVPLGDCLEQLVATLLNRSEIRSVGAWEVPVNRNKESWTSNFVCLKSCWGFDWQDGETERFFSCFKSECSAIWAADFKEAGGFDLRYKGVGMEEFHLGHKLEDLGKNNTVIRAATFEHYYKPLLKRCRILIFRTAKWVPLILSRRRFESKGAVGTSGAMFSILLTAIMEFSLVYAAFRYHFLLIFLLSFIVQIFIEFSFLKFAWKHFDFRVSLFSVVAIQIMNTSVGLGFLLGLLNVLLKRQNEPSGVNV